MKRNVAFFILAQTFFFGCNNATIPSGILYPAEKSMEVRYLCRLPYTNSSAANQKSIALPILNKCGLRLGATK